MSIRFALTVVALIALVTGFASCVKTSDSPEGVCGVRPPEDEACQAFFSRWFYKPDNNTCELISYSGCSPTGFATKVQCEPCLSK